jgi:hypothetical protein
LHFIASSNFVLFVVVYTSIVRMRAVLLFSVLLVCVISLCMVSAKNPREQVDESLLNEMPRGDSTTGAVRVIYYSDSNCYYPGTAITVPANATRGDCFSGDQWYPTSIMVLNGVVVSWKEVNPNLRTGQYPCDGVSAVMLAPVSMGVCAPISSVSITGVTNANGALMFLQE